MESSGVRVTPPGPSHWKTGVSVTPLGRVTVQVRVTMYPATIEEEEEDVREMDAGSGEISITDAIILYSSNHITYSYIWCSSHITG